MKVPKQVTPKRYRLDYVWIVNKAEELLSIETGTVLQALQCGASFAPVYVVSQTTASGAKRPLQYPLF